MEKGTLFFTEFPSGGVKFGYEDYDIECFGGGDYEAVYILDKENAEKMAGILSRQYTGSFEEMLIARFGIHLDQDSVDNWMEEHNIDFDLFTHIS